MNQDTIQASIAGVMPAVIATGLLVSLATFQLPDGLGATGFPRASYADVAGLIDIACTAPPVGTGDGFSADTMLTQPQNTARAEIHVLLDSYYPTAGDVWRSNGRVVIDGQPYRILGVEHDSQFQMSRVRIDRGSI